MKQLQLKQWIQTALDDYDEHKGWLRRAEPENRIANIIAHFMNRQTGDSLIMLRLREILEGLPANPGEADASPDQIWPLIDCLYNTPEWVLSPDSLTARIFLELKRTLDAELGDHTTQAIDILRRARILDEENITLILQYPQYAESITRVFRDWVRALIAEGTLAMPQLPALTYGARHALRNAGVRELITDVPTERTLTIDQVLELTYAASYALQDAGVRTLITAGTLTMEQVLALTHVACLALQNPEVRAFITAGTLTIPQVLALTGAANFALKDPGVRALITDVPTERTLTMEQVLALTYAASNALRNAGVSELITAGTLTMPQVLELTNAASHALQDPEVRALITDVPTERTLTIDQVLELTDAASYALQDAGVRTLITEGTLTMDQVLALTYAASFALRDPDTQQMIRDGRITIAEILAPVYHHEHGVAAVARDINPGQSTHTASVHRAVSESAIRLATRYGSMIEAPGLENTIKRLRAQVLSLPDDESGKNRVAKRCIERITEVDYIYTDDKSGITTRQLLALIFLAISDNDQRIGSYENAMARFVQGLYEIQRGYNLNGDGEDNGKDDSPICTGGTFNKLIATLVGVHPDFEIRYITRETAALKLPKVVQEEAMLYLSQLANPQTIKDLLAFTKLIAEIKKDGVTVIYDKIKPKITKRMFEEFKSLYREGKADASFTGLIDAGESVNTVLDNGSPFQKQVEQSKGYYEYCRQSLRQSAGFFSPQTSSEYLSERRHDSPKAQQEHDKRFGLVLRR